MFIPFFRQNLCTARTGSVVCFPASLSPYAHQLKPAVGASGGNPVLQTKTGTRPVAVSGTATSVEDKKVNRYTTIILSPPRPADISSNRFRAAFTSRARTSSSLPSHTFQSILNSSTAGRYQPVPSDSHHLNAGKSSHASFPKAIHSNNLARLFQPSAESVRPSRRNAGPGSLPHHAQVVCSSERSNPCRPPAVVEITSPRTPPSSNKSPGR